jgi:hypothetical protein
MRRVLAGHDFDLADLKRDRNGVMFCHWVRRKWK